jgi:hypothetical protein
VKADQVTGFMKIPRIPTKIKIAVFIAGSLLGIYTLLGFFLIPMLIKSQLPTLIQQETGRKTAVATARFDPFSLKLSLQGFTLQESNGQQFVGFDELFIDINGLESIGQRALVVDKMALNKPAVRIARDKEGQFNFKDLLKGNDDTKNDGNGVFPVNIAKLSIAEGKLDWEDAHFNSPEKETAYPINLDIENFTTQADQQSKLGMSLELNSGGKLDWQGTISLSPLSSTGHIKLEKVQLPRIQALALQDYVQLDLQGYELLETDYKADYVDDKFNISLNQSKLELHDFQVSATAHDKPMVKMVKFAVQGIGFDLNKNELTIESISADNADFTAWLNPDGVLSYQPLLPVAKTEEPPAEPVEETPWSIKVNNFALNNCGLTFEDQTLKKPATITVKPLNFQLANYNNEAGASLPFQLSAGLNETGLIKLDGNAVIEPLSAQIAVDAKGVDLAKFQAYVDKFAKLDIIDGKLAADGKVSIARSSDQDKVEIKFTGNTEIADLITRDQLKNKDFIKWESLKLNGIDADLPANQYSAKTLIINKPYVRLIIKKDRTNNFGDVVIADKNNEKGKQKQAATVKAAKNTQPEVKYKLGKIQIIEGSSDFSDLSLILPFAAQIKSLDGGASNISSDQKSTIKVDLKGVAYDLAPVVVKGEISPYIGDYDVSVSFTGMPMPLISSYMVQFAGYKVEKGKISLELNYKVSNRELTASNSILIDRLELGEKVENPNAVSLPLELAVALMKDSDGKIKLDVPITGSLEDPKFSVSHIIVDALVNTISKVITSPFRALASLVGSEADLSTISFPAGSAELDKKQISKLDDLVKALNKRSELKLEIKGAAYQEQDWPAVSDDALYDQLKRIKADEINKQGGRKIRAEHVVISDQDYRRLMEQLFVEKFPLMVEKTLLGRVRIVGTKADTNTHEFYAIAKDKLSAIIKPEEQRLKGLAAERSQAIAKYIVQKGGIANDRVFILDTAIDPAREDKEIVSLLSLKVD